MNARRGQVSLQLPKLLLVLATAIAGCTEEQINALLYPGVGTVTGRVQTVNGAPVPGVSISIFAATGTPKTGVTNANGIYEIADVGGGNAVIIVPELPPDYWSELTPVISQEVLVTANGDITRVAPFLLHQYATIRGVVRLADTGAPLPGVRVACSPDAQCKENAANSGPDGSYVFRIRAGTAEISPRVANLTLSGGRDFETISASEGDSRSLDLVLYGSGTVVARVMQGTFKVLRPDFQITLAGQGTQTTFVGETTFEGVVSGARDVSLTLPPGFELIPGESSPKRIQVIAGQTAEVEFQVRQPLGAISGRVRTVTGTAVPDVLISASSGADRRTTAGGLYTFSLLAGTHTVTITPPNGWELVPGQSLSVTRTVAVGENLEVDWTLRPIAQGTGTLIVHVRQGGVPFGDVTITLNGLSMSGATNANGDLVFNNVPAGTQTATITIPEDWQIADDDPVTKTVLLIGGGTTETTWNLCPEDEYVPPDGYDAPVGAVAPVPAPVSEPVPEDGRTAPVPEDGRSLPKPRLAGPRLPGH